jgi:XapX domain-containing protein
MTTQWILTILLATIAGAILGAIFERLDLPIPAPPVLSGVLGIFGVIVGSKIGALIQQMF